jgi:hypothetical protein
MDAACATSRNESQRVARRRNQDAKMRGVDVREFNRREMAAAKSRRATPAELREARERLKEIDAELQQMELLP